MLSLPVCLFILPIMGSHFTGSSHFRIFPLKEHLSFVFLITRVEQSKVICVAMPKMCENALSLSLIHVFIPVLISTCQERALNKFLPTDQTD